MPLSSRACCFSLTPRRAQIHRTWLPLSCGGEESDGEELDDEAARHPTSGEVKVSIHILEEHSAEEPLAVVPDEEEPEGPEVQRRNITVECSEFEVADCFECDPSPLPTSPAGSKSRLLCSDQRISL